MTLPRYRRFRFSLRTLFVMVAVICVALSWTLWSLNWIDQRRLALGNLAVYGNQTVPPLFASPLAPGGLWVFGERGQHTIRINTTLASKDYVIQIRRLFPEATLWLRSEIGRNNGDTDLAPGEFPK